MSIWRDRNGWSLWERAWIVASRVLFHAWDRAWMALYFASRGRVMLSTGRWPWYILLWLASESYLYEELRRHDLPRRHGAAR